MSINASNRVSLAAYRRSKGLPAEPEPAPLLPGSAPRVTTSDELLPTLRESVRVEKAKKRHKFAAQAEDGPDGSGGTRRYRSRLEAKLARRLEAERQIGGLVSFVPEVSVPVGTIGGKAVRHVVDQLAILEIRSDGTFVGKMYEAKGFDAKVGKRKREAVTKLYGLPVEVVR